MSFYETLVTKLEPLYRAPHVLGGHDEVHVRGVERLGEKMLTPLNIMSGPAHRHDLPHYDTDQPFGYKTNTDCHLKFHFWNVEWYGMLPYDWARELVDKDFFRQFLMYLRELGRDISERHGIQNGIEEDLKTALGPYYEEWW